MSNILETDSNSDVDIKIDNQYANNYNNWRKKEELNKLKTKYGEDINLDECSSSSSDDEEGSDLTVEVEKDFFKTLSYLKNKDPRIYNENFICFQQKKDTENPLMEKKKKVVPMYLKDYERKIILEKGGVFSDEEDNAENNSKLTTYVEEQKYIKESLKNALDAIEDDCDAQWGGLFNERNKSKIEKEQEESDYKKWLSGEKEIIDKKVATELKPLKDYWNNPNLDDGEKFLRDYILNKKFLDKDDNDYIPTYDEIIHDSDQDLSNDDDTIGKQEEFEHKYNFRFEEPDQQFIKRYPRTMENSARKVDDRRVLKRQEIKNRKKKEKEEKFMELRKLQELKRREIEEKLEKLKEITGNADIGFQNYDLDEDFDPEAHDRQMKLLFNEKFYQGPEEEQKPIFPEIDEELGVENWDKYEAENGNEGRYVPHCEDDDFNMDCDYNPESVTQNESIQGSNGKKKRRRKSKVAEALSQPKPKYDPNDKNYEKYFDEYYKLDCEDIIGDIPCRFKYRSVVPNSFGLSIEEILLAKERELNKWCSLKKTVQIRPDHMEKYDQIAYKKKAENINLKRKILPSLFAPELEQDDKHVEKGVEEDTLIDFKVEGNQKEIASRCNKKKVAVKKKNQNVKEQEADRNIKICTTQTKSTRVEKFTEKLTAGTGNELPESLNKKRRGSSSTNEETPRKRTRKHTKQHKKDLSISDARLSAYGINPKKFKNKLKFGNKRVK